jgi:hypothetical protein
LTRACHVKNVDLVLADKIGNQLCGVFSGNLGGVNQFVWPSLLNAEVDRLLGSSTQVAGVNDNGSIGILYVLQSSLGQSTVFQLLKWVTVRNSAEFIDASSRTPTAGFDSVLQRDIKRCAIDACLSARNDFHCLRRI